LMECAVRADTVPGALQTVRAVDPSGRNEERRFGEVATGPDQPYGECLGADLVTPFDAPPPPPRVGDRDTRLRAAGVFLEELEWGHRLAVSAAGTRHDVETGHVTGVPPEHVCRGAKGSRTGAVNPIQTDEAPRDVQCRRYGHDGAG